MQIKPITLSYKRQIGQGFKAFAGVPSMAIKDELRWLWGTEVQQGAITPEQYKKYTGEEYSAPEPPVAPPA